MSRIDKTFRFQSVMRLPSINNFDPQYFFREDNPLGIEMLIEKSFRDSFLQHSYSVKSIPQSEIRALAPLNGRLSDWEILSKLERLNFFNLAHLAVLLAGQSQNSDPGPLLHKEGKNFFYIPTPKAGVMKRVRVVDRPFAKKWVVGADDIDSLEECSPDDHFFVCWAHIWPFFRRH